MAAQYRIDTERGVVFTNAVGPFTDADATDHQRRLASDPAFRPDLDQLSDYSRVTELQLSAATVRSLALGSPFRAGSRRAFVIPARDARFGVARMFQTLTDDHGAELRIFQDMAEARAWLGLEPEPPAR